MSLRALLSVTCVSALAGLVACSGSKAPSDSTSPQGADAGKPAAAVATASSSKTPPHPCTFLTAQDAEAVLGAGATVKRESDSECSLDTPSPLGPSLGVKMEPVSDTWDGGEMMMKFDKTARKVEGIGDSAYTFMGGSIVFKKGTVEVTVITTAYKGAMSQFDAAKLIAERVAAKM
jgi:hypothetical protein